MARPSLLATWVVVLAVVAVCGGALLATPIGRQALVDERVRVIEALGGRVDDGQYAALQADPPALVYMTSGGRLLLMPPVTLAVAVGLMVLSAAGGRRLRFGVALAVVVHASVVLAVQQVIITPLHYVRESLTSPTTVVGLAPMLAEGSWAARLLGTVDVFGLWWLGLLAIGTAVATGASTGRLMGRLLAVYVCIAAVVATGFAVMGTDGI